MNKFKRFMSALLTVLMIVLMMPLPSVTANTYTSWYSERVGQSLSSFSTNHYSVFSKGQCTWYCYGRAREKLGVSLPLFSHDNRNADQWYSIAIDEGLSVGQDVRSNSIACYGNMHVIFIEWVDGDTVYFTEANMDGDGVFESSEDGVLKKNTISYIKGRLSGSYQGCIYLNESPTSHTVDSSYATNIEAYPKEKITAGNIFDANHNQISSTGWIGTSDLCTIHEVYTDGCCKVTYPLENGETRTVYSKISLFRASVPSIKYWVSSTEYGSEVSEGTAGNRYYLCYYLFDKISKQDWDEVVSSDYEIRLTIYNPDGSVKYTNENKFDYDRSWISAVFGEEGTYRVGFSVSGNWSGSATKSFTVKANPIKVNCSTNSVSLKLGETESKTIYVGYSGYYDGDWVLNYQRSNSNVSCTWGEWTDDHRSPLTIKANAMGSTTVTISVKDKDTGAILDSKTVTVTVGAKAYTVSYNANGGSGAPSSQTKYHNTTLAISSTIPTRSGYFFLGWSTSPTATRATYLPGDSFTENANTSLYAVWDLKTYVVCYNANGGSGEFVNQVKTHGVSLTLSNTVPTRAGYTFLGWSTSSTATSATYQPGGSFTSNANTTLYAVWKLNTTALSANSSNSAVISAGGEIKYFTFTPSTSGKYVIYSTGSDDTKVYLYNANWTELDSDDDGGDGNNFRLEYSLTAGTKYILGIKYYNSSKTGTIPFKFGKVYTITYNANGGSGAPSAQSKDYGTNITLSSTVPMRTGYTFLGWSTSSTATSAAFQAGSSFSNNANRTLYAVWKANTYTISYNANGGSGEPSNQTKTYGVNLTLSRTVPTRPGYSFLGWSTSSTATSASYQPGSSFTSNSNTTLYAIWKKVFYGDVNQDGVLDNNDILRLNRIRLDKAEATNWELFAGDLDGDGSITMDDFELLNAFISRKSTQFPVEQMKKTLMINTYPDQMDYCVGTQISTNGLSVILYYAETYECYYVTEYCDIVLPSTSSAGQKNVDISFGGLNTQYQVTVTSEHSYTYKTTKTPNTSATGILAGTCSKCSGTTTVTLPKLNTTDYTYKVTKSATCTATGTGQYTWKTTTYGSVYFDVTIDKTAHSWKMATCTSAQTCSVCGTTSGSPLGHSYIYDATKEPTTSTTGTLTGTCSQCSGTTTVTLPVLNATDYTYFISKLATCTKEGLIRYTWVMENNDSFYFDASIPATGHDMQQTAAEVAPTCETAGKTAVLTCANFLCSKTEGGEEIPAIGHSYENNVCTACGHERFATGDIDGENGVTYDDAVYLLLHTLFGEKNFPLTCAQGDIDGNGVVEQADAIYLLLHVLFGAEFYPLKD